MRVKCQSCCTNAQKAGHIASRQTLHWDAGQTGWKPGRPAENGTGGNPKQNSACRTCNIWGNIDWWVLTTHCPAALQAWQQCCKPDDAYTISDHQHVSTWLGFWCYVIGLSSGSIAVSTLPLSTLGECMCTEDINRFHYSMLWKENQLQKQPTIWVYQWCDQTPESGWRKVGWKYFVECRIQNAEFDHVYFAELQMQNVHLSVGSSELLSL